MGKEEEERKALIHPPHGSPPMQQKEKKQSSKPFFPSSHSDGGNECVGWEGKGETLHLPSSWTPKVRSLSFFFWSILRQTKQKRGDFQEPPKQDIGGEGGGRSTLPRRNSIRRKNTAQKTFFIQSTFEGRSNFVLPHKHAPLEFSRNNFLCCCSSKKEEEGD